jgi:transcriptional regulator GlxA family with amidase domain
MAVSKGMAHEDAVIRRCQDWIARHYMAANPVGEMIARSGLSPTSFARRFRRATGERPMDYVHQLRVDQAKRLLETTASAVDGVGHTVGYEDPASVRRIFKRTTSLTPRDYRRRFSHDRFAAE